MKGKNVFRIVIFTLIILYTVLYITQATGYYEYTNRKTNTLTEKAVEQFEKDLKAGKKVSASDYIKEENDYNNKMSKGGVFLSSAIGSVFDSVMKFIFNEVSKAVEEQILIQ